MVKDPVDAIFAELNEVRRQKVVNEIYETVVSNEPVKRAQPVIFSELMRLPEASLIKHL